jgi:hypothetical protein
MNRFDCRYNCVVIMLLIVMLLFIATTLFASECDVKSTDFDRNNVFKILRDGGFSGVLNQSLKLRKVGAIKIKNTCMKLFVCTQTWKPEGSTGSIHMVKALLILSNTKYLGFYAIDELPIRLVGNVLEFPGPKEYGNSIVFSKETPPAKIYLDGEVRRLFK